jgi:hypothetical protein
MFGTLIVLCVMGYGIKRLAGYAKNNPGQSMEVAKWLKQMFGKWSADRCNNLSVRAINRCPHGILLEDSMFTVIRIVSQFLLFILAMIGLALLLILWDIRQHPLSVFYYLHLLMGLPFWSFAYGWGTKRAASASSISSGGFSDAHVNSSESGADLDGELTS